MKNCTRLIQTCSAAALFAVGLAAATTLSKADRDFLNSAARMDMTAVHEAQMADNQATRADVKDLARKVEKDDNDAFNQLSQLAVKTGVTIPQGINSAKVPAIEGLVNLKGAHFDRQFAKDQVAGEQQALALFRREAKSGRDTDVKAYASKMIPVLDNDLKQARQCAAATPKSAATR